MPATEVSISLIALGPGQFLHTVSKGPALLNSPWYVHHSQAMVLN